MIAEGASGEERETGHSSIRAFFLLSGREEPRTGEAFSGS